MDSETVLVNLEMPVGTPVEQTERALKVVEDSVLRLRETGEVRSVYTLVGAQASAGMGSSTVSYRSHIGQAIIELASVDQRDRSSDELINQLRHETGHIPGVNSLTYGGVHGGPAGTDIQIEITGQQMDSLLSAADVLKTKLASFEGTYDISDDFDKDWWWV